MTVFIESGDTASWQDIRDKIRGDLWRPGTGIPDDVIDRALHAALLELEAEQRWLWLENLTLGLTFDDDGDSLALPASVAAISALSLVDGASKDVLKLVPLSTVRNMSPGSNGKPTYYALGDGVLWFDTVCPAGTQFELIFSAQTPEYLADAVETYNWTLARHQEAVLALACARVALGFLKDTENAARHQTIYQRDLTRLLNRENLQRTDETGGCIMPDQSYAADAFGYGGP